MWLPSDGTLKWTTKVTSTDDPTPIYHVTAFRGHHQEFVDISQPTTDEKVKSNFRGFLSFFGKSTVERARLSSADPTNIVNSCADKFQKGK